MKNLSERPVGGEHDGKRADAVTVSRFHQGINRDIGIFSHIQQITGLKLQAEFPGAFPGDESVGEDGCLAHGGVVEDVRDHPG